MLERCEKVVVLVVESVLFVSFFKMILVIDGRSVTINLALCGGHLMLVAPPTHTHTHIYTHIHVDRYVVICTIYPNFFKNCHFYVVVSLLSRLKLAIVVMYWPIR